MDGVHNSKQNKFTESSAEFAAPLTIDRGQHSEFNE